MLSAMKYFIPNREDALLRVGVLLLPHPLSNPATPLTTPDTREPGK
jgi:hypothetical protein